jgi:hypothetical protein
MDAEINNFIHMELYSEPKMVHGKYEKTNIARSIDRDSTVCVCVSIYIGGCVVLNHKGNLIFPQKCH